ncbi:hypothetical protein LEP48_11980 [Isoptericola sp. NEAU-Y5]|uniref:Knr4/Smi1-like domain-containing protein n=1 Tax=Isoptericola luteus TaxID=2879484 RepID=A0ABS7ZGA5_9MICO|nr:hypothetical protein [Isoptericola sp. NEAU-Y5]MCA5894061.1 hypothetical protein [Isoptericola sp. NEAU-Y5]
MSTQDLIDAGNLTPPAAPYDWAGTEQRLEMAVPEDFRQLLDAGGAGQWFGYIRLFAPGHPLPSQDLLESPGVFRDLLVLWDDDPEFRPDDLPEDSRLIAWANTGNGETVFWRVDPGASPADHTVYVEDADGERWERFDLGATAFLEGIMNGSVECELFSDTFLRVDRVFDPYPPA